MVTLCPQGEEAQGPGLLSHTCHCFPEASPKIRGGPVAGTSSLPAGSWEESHREGKEREVKWKLRLVCTHPSFSEMGPFCGPPQATGPRKAWIHSADQVLQQRAGDREMSWNQDLQDSQFLSKTKSWEKTGSEPRIHAGWYSGMKPHSSHPITLAQAPPSLAQELKSENPHGRAQTPEMLADARNTVVLAWELRSLPLCSEVSHCPDMEPLAWSLQRDFQNSRERITADLSIETLQARREWQHILKVMKEKNLQPRLLYPARISFRYEGEIKSFTSKSWENSAPTNQLPNKC